MTYAKSQLDKIDKLLDLFRVEEKGIRESFVCEMMTPYYKLSESEIKRFLNQLKNDEYIFLWEDYYIITIKGILFNGYKKQSKASRTIRCVLIFQNWILAAGTGLAGLYGLFEILKWFYHHFEWMQRLKFWN